jgi:hypothetical protein
MGALISSKTEIQMDGLKWNSREQLKEITGFKPLTYGFKIYKNYRSIGLRNIKGMFLDFNFIQYIHLTDI